MMTQSLSSASTRCKSWEDCVALSRGRGTFWPAVSAISQRHPKWFLDSSKFKLFQYAHASHTQSLIKAV
jgi:hypothetical protein